MKLLFTSIFIISILFSIGMWKFYYYNNPSPTTIIVEQNSRQEKKALPTLDKNRSGYYETSADIFTELANNPEVTTVNVHVPFVGDIPGTEMSIPYNDIEALLSALPEDKSAPIALYCQGGGMSNAASIALVKAGYTNVYDLTGGMNAYIKSGRELQGL